MPEVPPSESQHFDMSYVPFNPLSPEHRNDPFKLFEELARNGPLHRTRSGLWLVCGHELATRVLKDRTLRTDYTAALARTYGEDFLGHASLRYLCDSFILTADKANGEIRRHFAGMMSRARAQSQANAMSECARSLLNQPLLARRSDLLSEFAVPFTLATLGKLLSMPADLLGGIPDGLLAALDCAKLSASALRTLDEQVLSSRDRFVVYLESKTAQQSECASGLLAIACKYGLSLDSVFADLLFIVMAGRETTATLIAQIAWFLAAHPETAAELAAAPSDASLAIEEFARLFPAIHIVTRRPSTDMELEGRVIRSTETILVLIAAANRDPSVFSDPGTFIPARPEISRALAFGAGIHYCLGAAVAREETRIALVELLKWGALAGKAVSPSWRRLGVFRSLDAMWLT